MSYQVLARKWRPQNFKQMVGQEHVLRALMNALDSDRLHHAYLFTGTRGVGKTTIARILAKCLNCETGITSTPCGECNSCKEIAGGNFLDLIEVDAASRTKVEDTRELLENVQYAPTRARFKVYLIDEVHMLTGHSFNALLKTLEEPPPHVKFLFATTDPQKLPATILSRCLQFNLKRMPVDMISGHLDYLLQQESIKFEAPSLRLLARAADGSMRDALSLLDQSIVFSGADITEASVRDMLGTISHEPLIDLLTLVLAGEGARLLKQVDDLSSVTPDFAVATDALIMLLHQLAVQQVVPDAINEEQGIVELAHKITKEEVQLFYQIALQGRRDLALSPDPRSGFEMLLLRMMTFRPLREGMQLEQSVMSQVIPQSVEADNKKKTLSPEQGNTKASEFTLELSSESLLQSSLEPSLEPSSISEAESVNTKISHSEPLMHDASKSEGETTKHQQAKSTVNEFSSKLNDPVPPWEDMPPFLEQDHNNTVVIDVDHDAKDKAQETDIISPEASKIVPKNIPKAVPKDKAQDVPENFTRTNETAIQTKIIDENNKNDQTIETLEDLILQTTDEDQHHQPCYELDEQLDRQNGTENNTADDQELEEASTDAGHHEIPETIAKASIDTNQPWHAIVPQLKLSGRANELIKHCLLVSHENGIITLKLNKDSEDLYAESTQQEIQKAIIDLFGTNTRLELNIAVATTNKAQQDKALETPAQRSIRKVSEAQQQAEHNIKTDPFVIELKDRFGAKLVPGSIQPK